MSDQNNNSDTNEEIDLIDLIAVLVRYRKFILGTLIVSVVLTIAAYFIIPVLNSNKLEKTYNTSVITEFFATPDVMDFTDMDTLKNYMSQLSTDPEIILGALKATGAERYDGIDLAVKDKALLLESVKNLLQAEQALLTFKNNNVSVSLTMKIPENFKYTLFLNSMLSQINDRMQTLLNPYAMGKIWEFENITLKDLTPAGIDAALFKKYSKYATAKRFASNKVPSLMMTQNPLVLTEEPKTDKFAILKKGIIASFAAVFLAIFLSFLFNWIAIVKQDPEAMEKLKKAKSGKL